MYREIIAREFRKWSLALSILPVVIIVLVLKFIVHMYNLEVLQVNALFSGLIAANVFLLGFLISSVLVDYKESEKLPGELAASLMSILDEVLTIYKVKEIQIAKDCLKHTLALTASLKNWFYKKENTDTLMSKLSHLNDFLDQLEKVAGAASISRIKAEQSAIRRMVIRARTIRGTFFVPSGYAIAEMMNILVIIMLLLAEVPSIYHDIFFIGLITFVNTYMLMLIKQLDNPFDYYSKAKGADEISLMPLDEVIRLVEPLVKGLDERIDTTRVPA